MKLVPAPGHIIGRIVVRKPAESLIVSIDQAKVTKFILVDAVGEGVDRAKVGDVLIPLTLKNIVLEAGFRPMLDQKDIAFYASDFDLEKDFHVQTDTGLGQTYVSFDDKNAAVSWGLSATEQKAA